MKYDLKITTGMAAALMLSACGSDDNGWKAQQDTAVCTDKQGTRVPDENCRTTDRGGGTSNAFLWYFLGRNSMIPYYGERVGGGSYTRSGGTSYFRAPAGSAMTRSTAISRGGFGSSAEGHGGFGE